MAWKIMAGLFLVQLIICIHVLLPVKPLDHFFGQVVKKPLELTLWERRQTGWISQLNNAILNPHGNKKSWRKWEPEITDGTCIWLSCTASCASYFNSVLGVWMKHSEVILHLIYMYYIKFFNCFKSWQLIHVRGCTFMILFIYTSTHFKQPTELLTFNDCHSSYKYALCWLFMYM